MEQQRARVYLYRKHYSAAAAAGLVGVAVVHHALRVAAFLALWVVRPSRRRSLHTKIRQHVACLGSLLST